MARNVVRVNISMPPDWAMLLRKHARDQGLTVSRWVLHQLANALPTTTVKKLSEPQDRGRPPNE